MELFVFGLHGDHDRSELRPTPGVSCISYAMDHLYNVLQQSRARVHTDEAYQQILFPR